MNIWTVLTMDDGVYEIYALSGTMAAQIVELAFKSVVIDVYFGVLR